MGGFQELNVLRLLRVESAIAREFLLKIDTSLAVATSGLRTNLLFGKPPSENPPIRFPPPREKRCIC